MDRVSLFTLDTSGRWQVQQAGDHVPVSQWPVPHRYPLFPLLVSAEDPRHYLLRVENSHSFSAPLDFVSEGALLGREQRTSLILGIYFGLAGLAALLGALSAISLRDRAYALYALSVTLMALSQAAITGIAGLHLWPDWPWWNDQAPLVLPVLALAALLCFFSELVSVRERSPSLQRWLMFLALLSLPVAAAILLFEPSHRVQLMVPYIVGMSAAIVTAAALGCAPRRPLCAVGADRVAAGHGRVGRFRSRGRRAPCPRTSGRCTGCRSVSRSNCRRCC